MAESEQQQQQQQQQREKSGVDLDQDEFCCSVCLELLKDPVTLNCGHSYCRTCIEGYWDQGEVKVRVEYSCPQCREAFSPRPVLRRNHMLAEVVMKLRKSGKRPPPPVVLACAGAADVACDFCCGLRRVKAVKSCLTCMVSLCEAHVEPHYSVPVLQKHKLVSVSIPLQEKMCTKHAKPLEVYCRTDRQLFCSLCSIEEHREHQTVPASEEKAAKKKQLAVTTQKVQQRVQERERELTELSKAVEVLKGCAQTSADACDKILTELITSIERQRSDVKKLISAQEKTAVIQAEELQLQVEEEISKLRRMHAELEHLCGVDDDIHFIKSFQSLSSPGEYPDLLPDSVLRPQRSFGDLIACVSDLRTEVESVLKDTWPRISTTASYVDFSLPPTPKTRDEFLKYCCPLTLDVTSNYAYLYVLDDKRWMRPSPSPYSAHPDRFTKFPQVLCAEALSDRHYWEVEWNARTLSAAVSYKDISRAADDSEFGNNDKSWSLECCPDGYSFKHNSAGRTVAGPRSNTVGVYLDYKAGTLSFYSVSDTAMTLLHKVHATFTQPVYPGLGLKYEWYDVGVFAQLVKLR